MSLPESTFAGLALVLLLCSLAGAVFVRLRQPLLLTWMAAGIALGPAGLGLVAPHSTLELLAQIGLTVLLFIVGLKLDLEHLRNIGPVALATGLGQLFFTIVIGLGILLALGREPIEALYVAIALTFSSTIIIVKLLSDKRELDSLHGRIAVGFLVVQDVAVVLAMMAMSALRQGEGEGAGALALSMVGRLALAALATGLLMRFVLPRLSAWMARSQELMLLFAVAWGVALAALGEHIGFSKEAGAFLAGFSLASTPFRDAMSARLAPLRDFLLLFFFLELGAGMDLSSLGSDIAPALLLSLFVLVGNPLIVMVIMGFMGYRRRTGFLAGLAVAQISEFSIVFVAMGISLGHIGPAALGLTTLVGMLTITGSTYLILYAHPIYARIEHLLRPFERKHPWREAEVDAGLSARAAPQVIIFGLWRYGLRLFERLKQAGIPVLGVDFDPELIRELRARGEAVVFGDAEDEELLDTLPLGTARFILSSLAPREANLALLRGLELRIFSGELRIAQRQPFRMTAESSGLTLVMLSPYTDAADHAADELIARLDRPQLPS